MYIFDLKSTLSWNPIHYYSNEDLFHSCVFALFTISAFTLSYFISYNTKNIFSAIKLNIDVADVLLYKTGIVLCIIAGLSRVFCDI